MHPAESEGNVSSRNVNTTISEHCDDNEDGSPLLRGPEHIGLESPNCGIGMLSSPLCNLLFRKDTCYKCTFGLGTWESSYNTIKVYSMLLSISSARS